MRWVRAFVALLAGLACFGQVAEAQLDVTFATTRTGGRYYPAHVMAVWVTAPDGSFERTLHVWGSRRRSHLSQWASSRPTTDSLDGITSATLRTDATQEVTWDMRDSDGNLVPDGSYLLHFELADTNSTSANHRTSFTFEKRPDGFDQTSDMNPFVMVHIHYTPVMEAPGVDAGPDRFVDAGGPSTDPNIGADGHIIPVGRGYGSRGCSAAPRGPRDVPIPVAVAIAIAAGLRVTRRRRR